MQLSPHAISSICSLSLFCTEHTWWEPIDFIAPTKTWYKCLSMGTSAGWILLLINKLSFRKHWTGHYLSFNYYFLSPHPERKKKKRKEREKEIAKRSFYKNKQSIYLLKKKKKVHLKWLMSLPSSHPFHCVLDIFFLSLLKKYFFLYSLGLKFLFSMSYFFFYLT